MVFQKGKPRPPFKVKSCPVCRASFEPTSGSQTFCSVECRRKGKAQGLGAKRAPREKRQNVKEAVARALGDWDEGGVFFNGQDVNQETQEASREVPKTGQGSKRGSSKANLELDLTPLEDYIRQVIADEMSKREASSSREGNGELRELVREVVREEIAERLRPLLGG